MTMIHPDTLASPQDRLSKIEALVQEVRAGRIDESEALYRIAVLAQSASSGDIYQKSWG